MLFVSNQEWYSLEALFCLMINLIMSLDISKIELIKKKFVINILGLFL